ncbi:MAG TPA: PQQ-dependent sugar dehydrogenase [Nitrososphaeraceae archaeon]|nr:PQQ-dependent sugar dehydrogenase [Nitrososphaeraceae archaeon]
MNFFVTINVFIRNNHDRFAVIGQPGFRPTNVLILIGVLILNIPTVTHSLYAQIANAGDAPQIPGSLFSEGEGAPNMTDPTLKADLIYKGLEFPTNMALLGPDDFLVLEKSKGTVNRIVNGALSAEPLLQVNVASEVERGMLGIAISNASNQTGIDYNNVTTSHGPYVFLYYTEAVSPQDDTPIGNRVYRYELVDNKLTNPKLLLDLPAIPGPRHNGGSIAIGPDNNLYVAIGDVDGHTTEAENVHEGGRPDGTGGILRITQDGKPVQGIIGDQSPSNKYFGYGIRNSFGFDFDPLSGNLWDSDNGPGSNDEINLVEPGFNGGWLEIQGKAPAGFDAQQLVNFGGKGVYRDPEFTWVDTVGPTKVLFFDSDKLGEQYENDMLVADVHFGRIYNFDLYENRTGLVLDGPIADKVAETDEEVNGLIFGSEFGAITDLEVGPDGYLYVLSFGQGAIYRVHPNLG